MSSVKATYPIYIKCTYIILIIPCVCKHMCMYICVSMYIHAHTSHNVNSLDEGYFCDFYFSYILSIFNGTLSIIITKTICY